MSGVACLDLKRYVCGLSSWDNTPTDVCRKTCSCFGTDISLVDECGPRTDIADWHGYQTRLVICATTSPDLDDALRTGRPQFKGHVDKQWTDRGQQRLLVLLKLIL